MKCPQTMRPLAAAHCSSVCRICLNIHWYPSNVNEEVFLTGFTETLVAERKEATLAVVEITQDGAILQTLFVNGMIEPVAAVTAGGACGHASAPIAVVHVANEPKHQRVCFICAEMQKKTIV